MHQTSLISLPATATRSSLRPPTPFHHKLTDEPLNFTVTHSSLSLSRILHSPSVTSSPLPLSSPSYLSYSSSNPSPSYTPSSSYSSLPYSNLTFPPFSSPPACFTPLLPLISLPLYPLANSSSISIFLRLLSVIPFLMPLSSPFVLPPPLNLPPTRPRGLTTATSANLTIDTRDASGQPASQS